MNISSAQMCSKFLHGSCSCCWGCRGDTEGERVSDLSALYKTSGSPPCTQHCANYQVLLLPALVFVSYIQLPTLNSMPSKVNNISLTVLYTAKDKDVPMQLLTHHKFLLLDCV